MNLMKSINILLILVVLVLPKWADADVMEEVVQLQKRWAEVNYTLKSKEQNSAFELLITDAGKVVASYPSAAEAWIWRGIINSSFAGAKGGLGAMSFAKAAKKDLEKALTINDSALSGSAYTSLGTLYFKVPGWPIGFGDEDKAKEMLETALILNPDGIDSNYFYAEFLRDQRRYDKAEQYLIKAQQAPERPSRPLADKGRHDEIEQSLAKVRQQLSKKNSASITDRR